MTDNEAFDTLERYYLTIYDYNQDSNFEDFDVDVQFTKQRLEKIVDNRFVDTEDISFLQELLDEEDLGDSVSEAVKYLIGDSLWQF